MAKNDLIESALTTPASATSSTIKTLVEVLDTDPKYALTPDPTGSLNLSEDQKKFIELYINFRNFGVVASMMKIKVDDAVDIYMSFNVKNEIERINNAIHQHQYAHRMLELDEMGGYLSALVEDKYVPEVDRLKPMDKVKVIDMLLKLQGAKALLSKDAAVDITDMDDNIKELSVASIQHLISTIESGKGMPKEFDEDTEDKLAMSGMSPSDIEALKNLPTEDVIRILNDATKK